MPYLEGAPVTVCLGTRWQDPRYVGAMLSDDPLIAAYQKELVRLGFDVDDVPGLVLPRSIELAELIAMLRAIPDGAGESIEIADTAEEEFERQRADIRKKDGIGYA